MTRTVSSAIDLQNVVALLNAFYLVMSEDIVDGVRVPGVGQAGAWAPAGGTAPADAARQNRRLRPQDIITTARLGKPENKPLKS